MTIEDICVQVNVNHRKPESSLYHTKKVINKGSLLQILFCTLQPDRPLTKASTTHKQGYFHQVKNKCYLNKNMYLNLEYTKKLSPFLLFFLEIFNKKMFIQFHFKMHKVFYT